MIFESDPELDVWTCDQWKYNGIWTSKAYALHGWGSDASPYSRYRAPWISRRWGCGAINPLSAHYCKRCGFPNPFRKKT